MKKAISSTVVVLFVWAAAITCIAQTGYKQPPKEIMDVLNAPAIPNTSISPTRDRIALLVPLRHPPIADLSEPMLRLAGTRFNPATNARATPTGVRAPENEFCSSQWHWF